MYTHHRVAGAFSSSNTQMFACVCTYLYVYFVLVEYSISFTLQTIGLVRVSVLVCMRACVCVIFFLCKHQNFPDKVVILHPTRRRRDQGEKCGANTKYAAHTHIQAHSTLPSFYPENTIFCSPYSTTLNRHETENRPK